MRNEGATTSLRCVAAPAILVLPTCGRTTASKPSDSTANNLERRHDEMIKRMGASSGM